MPPNIWPTPPYRAEAMANLSRRLKLLEIESRQLFRHAMHLRFLGRISRHELSIIAGLGHAAYAARVLLESDAPAGENVIAFPVDAIPIQKDKPL